jgi:hypothetical protein
MTRMGISLSRSSPAEVIIGDKMGKMIGGEVEGDGRENNGEDERMADRYGEEAGRGDRGSEEGADAITGGVRGIKVGRGDK